MATDWKDVSKPAKGWDTVAKPLNPPPPAPKAPAPEEIAAEEAKRAEAKRQAEIKEQERKEQLEREEARRIEERKIRLRKESEERRDKRNEVRQKTLHRGFMIDQFTETATRVRKAAVPVLVSVLMLGGTAAALTLMFKAATSDISQCFGFGGGRGSGAPAPGDGGTPPAPKPPPAPNGDPHGHDIPDDPNGIWGWDKHCGPGQKEKCTPPGYKEPGAAAAGAGAGGAPGP